MTENVSVAPPVTPASTAFIAASIANIEIKDMPQAVLKAGTNDICLERIMVSSTIEVKMPLTMASAMIDSVVQGIAIIWKKKMVPKSPIEQPIRHQTVLMLERYQVCRQVQEKVEMGLVVSMDERLFDSTGTRADLDQLPIGRS